MRETEEFFLFITNYEGFTMANNIPGALSKEVLEFFQHKGQDMVQHFQKMQTDLENKRVVGLGGVEDEDGIFVKTTLNGLQECINVTYGSSAFDDTKVAADLTRAAFNDATTKLKAVMQQEVVSVYEKSGLPLTGEEGEE